MLVKKADSFKTDSTSVHSESYWHFYLSGMKMGESNVWMAEYTSEVLCLEDNFKNLILLLCSYESKCCNGFVTDFLEIMLWKWIEILSFSIYSYTQHMEDEITVSEVSQSSKQTSKLYDIECGHWIEGHSGDKSFLSSS